MTDFRALCVELVEAWDSYSYADAGDAADRMAEAVKAARAALAQPAPPAEGEVGELVDRLGRIADGARAMGYAASAKDWPSAMDWVSARGWEQDARTITRAAELLQQRHAEPVPVSERLPGPEDCTNDPCNGQGQWCWGWVQHDQPFYSGRWRMMRREWLYDEARAWLPATALPLPAGEGEE